MLQVFESKQTCCGCGSCAFLCPTGAISMEADADGFVYPRIDQEKCIDCGRCRASCAFHARTADPAAMPSAVYALRHKDLEVLKHSTSGGAFTAISDAILDRGGVVFGAALDEHLQVRHICAETKQERDAMRGSKYVQSDLNTVFPQVKEQLRRGREVLFVGTPCQVDALRHYLRGEEHNRLFTCDFICHGVPNQRLFDDYCAYVEQKSGQKIKTHLFRDKQFFGWSHMESNLYTDGKWDGTSFLSQIQKTAFYSGIAQRDSCFSCKYTNLDRPGDLTIADFWGVENCLPSFADKRGVSLVMLNTEKGTQLFEQIKNTCDFEVCAVESALSAQPHTRQPLEESPLRAAFWEEYHKNGYEAAIRKYLNCGLRGRFSHWTKRVGLYPALYKIKTALKL